MPASLRSAAPASPFSSLAASAELCPSCGAPVASHFCGECGERRLSDRHYSLSHFTREVFETVTDTDGRLLRSFITLLRRPGELTAAYMRGARTRYVPPLRLFLWANVLYFVAATWGGGIQSFNSSLHVQRSQLPYSPYAARLIDAKVAALGTTVAAYEKVFDGATTTLAKTLVIAMVPAFALLVAIVTVGRRRRYALQHIVFGLHTYATLFALIVFMTYAVAYPAAYAFHWAHLPNPSVNTDLYVITPILIGLLWLYNAAALRTAYGQSRIRATLGGMVLVVGMGAILTGYRFLLLVITLATT